MLRLSISFLRSPNQCKIPTAPEEIPAREDRGSLKKCQNPMEINLQNHQVTGQDQKQDIPMTVLDQTVVLRIPLRESMDRVTVTTTATIPALPIEGIREAVATIPALPIEGIQEAVATIPAHRIEGIQVAVATIPALRIEGIQEAAATIPALRIEGIQEAVATIPAHRIEGIRAREIILVKGMRGVATSQDTLITVIAGMTGTLAAGQKEM
jgi:hypothetical protein